MTDETSAVPNPAPSPNEPEQVTPAAQTATPDPTSDPLADTQPVEVNRFAPTPDPRPDARWAWAQPQGAPQNAWYDPAPAEPQGGASAPWMPAGTAPSPATPPPPHGGTGGHGVQGSGAPAFGTFGYGAAYGEPAAVPRPAAPMDRSPSRQRRGAGVGTVIVASALSAVLASGGTVAVLGQQGVFNRPAQTSGIGNGQTTGTQPVTINESSAVIDAAAKVGPAVVKITTEGTTTDPFGTVPSEGVGSGFIYDVAGWILTNRHVVSGANRLTVELKDGRQFPGTVYGIDTLTDLAIVKIEGTDLPVAGLGKSDGLKIGQLVVAIGSPLGTYSFSVTSGIVSAKGRDISVDNGATRITNLIQTDAAINPGNSGGPLVDANGAVVGINTAVATDGSGIGFAIPVDIARPIMEQAVKGQELARPWIGIRFLTLDLKIQKELATPVADGALVSNQGGTGSAVVDGSPAAAAGLQDGDIITAVSGITLDGEHPLDATLVRFAPGDTVTLDVLRDGKTIQLTVVLGTRPANP